MESDANPELDETEFEGDEVRVCSRDERNEDGTRSRLGGAGAVGKGAFATATLSNVCF